MKYISIFLITTLVFIFNISFSQKITDKFGCHINHKTLNSFKYNAPVKKYKKYKITCKTILNRSAIKESFSSNEDLSEILDESQFSQFIQYNLRFRIKFKNQNHFFIGTKTFLESGSSKGLSYIGFKKYF